MEGVGVGGNLAMILILSTSESPVSDVGWNTGGGGGHLAEVQTLPWKFTS